MSLFVLWCLGARFPSQASHNAALVALAAYCSKASASLPSPSTGEGMLPDDEEKDEALATLFYLEGPDAGTTRALAEAGVDLGRRCFVANRHARCARMGCEFEHEMYTRMLYNA